MQEPAPDITQLLEAWTGDDRAALDALMPSVIDELRRMAASFLAREPHARTLQASALVNEAYLRLVRVRPHAWENRGQFFALTAQIMRHILVDHARSQLSIQRGGGKPHVPLGPRAANERPGAAVVGLHEALLSLEAQDARKGQIVEMKIFGGLTNQEVAEALGVSERTVIREWQFSRAWLARELNFPVPHDD